MEKKKNKAKLEPIFSIFRKNRHAELISAMKTQGYSL